MPSNHDVLLLAFTEDCYEQVLSLWRACEGIGLSEADSRENIMRFLGRNPGSSFVAWAGETLAGAVLAGHDGRRGYMHHLAVHPAYRRHGIARLLIEKSLEALRAQGIDKCHGFVFLNNRSGLDFWEHNGWSIREDIRLISRPIKEQED